jgi:hypothetical protein
MMKHGAVITFAASLLFLTSAFFPHDLSAEGNVDMLKVVQVEQRILLFMDELDALSQSIPYSTKDQLKQSEKALAAGSAKWNIYTQSVNEVIASDEELSQGKYLAYESFDWRCGYVAVGVNGNFERYHLGDDLDKICELSQMLQTAFRQVGKKRKAKFPADKANLCVIQVTRAFMESVK